MRHESASLYHKVKARTYTRLGLHAKAASHLRRAAVHAAFGTQPKAVRVVALNENADSEIVALRSLPLECDTIFPEMRTWTLTGNTAVYFNGRSIVQNDRVGEVLAAIRDLGPDQEKPTRIVVIVEFSGQIDASFTAAFADAEVTLTTHILRPFAALVYAPDHAVLLDVDTQGSARFVVCTVVPSTVASVGEIAKADYCAGVQGNRLRAESMYLCHRKVLAFALDERQKQQDRMQSGTKGHEIVGDFDRVFVTSDVHADLRKFMQILLACKLISIGTYTHGHLYENDTNIYEIVWEAKWVAPKTLLVICGDIIDSGFGSAKYAELNALGDERGSYEFLLHCLLFNLRIQARKVDSDVQFTIGNHDSATVTGCATTCPTDGIDPFYVYYGHMQFARMGMQQPRDKLERAFITGQLLNRRNMLIPFYACSPYLMLTLGKVAFVHAGFVWQGSDQYNEALKKQTVLDTAALHANTNLVDFFEPTRSDANTLRFLWTREYFDEHEVACKANTSHDFELIAVGHCVTHEYKSKQPSIERLLDEQCNGYTTNGCVLTRDCRTEDGKGPLLALVDTGMSATFRNGGDATNLVVQNSTREVGMLLLSKSEERAYEIRKVDDYRVYRILSMKETRFLQKNGESAFGKHQRPHKK
jgi:hypothetical protein